MKKGAEKLTGVEAIMHTPFKENYDLDLDGAKTIVRHIIDGGVIEGSGCILIGGAVGEAQHMNPLERKELLKACCEVANKETPTIFNCAHTDVRIVLELAKSAYENGATFIQIAPPYYMPLSDKEIIDFYKFISDEVPIGIMAYANYWASQVYFDNIWDELIAIENIISIKWAHPDMTEFIKGLVNYSDTLSFMDNMGTAGPWPFMLGMNGFVSQIGVWAPKIALKQWGLIKDKDWKGLEDFYNQVIIPFMEWNWQMSGPLGFHGEGTALKAASHLLKLPAGPCRRPHQHNVSTENMDKLKILLESWDLI